MGSYMATQINLHERCFEIVFQLAPGYKEEKVKNKSHVWCSCDQLPQEKCVQSSLQTDWVRELHVKHKQKPDRTHIYIFKK